MIVLPGAHIQRDGLRSSTDSLVASELKLKALQYRQPARSEAGREYLGTLN
jgi:hypothetical protein